jgi:hypothetical protein
MADQVKAPSLTKHQRKLLRLIDNTRFFRVHGGYRGTGTQLIKLETARNLKRQRLAREAMARTARGTHPVLQITGHGKDMLAGIVQEHLL